MRKFYTTLCIAVAINLSAVSIAKAQTFSLVKDINSGPASSLPEIPWESISINGILYVVADDGVHGKELWRSDGTEWGTFLLKELSASSVNAPVSLTDVSGTLYFTAGTLENGFELWKSDGTEEGTILVKSFNVIDNNPDLRVLNLTNVNGTLYFTAGTLENGSELWKSDGTEEGTVIVKDIVAGTGSSKPRALANIKGTLYFSASTLENGSELWKSDGTEEGTIMVKNINPGNADSDPRDFNYINGVTIFFANKGEGNRGLWKTDGTEAGTVQLSNVSANQLTTFYNEPFLKATIGRNLFFAGISSSGSELWKTDGTVAGTMMVKDINPSGNSGVTGLTVANGWLFFVADDGIHGRELWKSDGTKAGTIMVRDVWPGPSTGCTALTGTLSSINGKVMFIGNDGTATGAQPWRSDGTEAGTYMMDDIIPPSAVPLRSAVAGSKYFISFQHDIVGRELFATTIPEEGAPLALTMIDISARLDGNNGLLKWKTTHEESVFHFEIERSLDNHNYTVAGIVRSNNMNGTHDYSFTDRDITSLRTSVVFYRLKLVDVNNQAGYSKTFAIGLSENKPTAILYPLPAHDATTLMIPLRRKENLTVNILDMTGKIMKQKRVAGYEGNNLIQLEISSLLPGTYTVMINGEMTNSSTRLLKR